MCIKKEMRFSLSDLITAQKRKKDCSRVPSLELNQIWSLLRSSLKSSLKLSLKSWCAQHKCNSSPSASPHLWHFHTKYGNSCGEAAYQSNLMKPHHTDLTTESQTFNVVEKSSAFQGLYANDKYNILQYSNTYDSIKKLNWFFYLTLIKLFYSNNKHDCIMRVQLSPWQHLLFYWLISLFIYWHWNSSVKQGNRWCHLWWLQRGFKKIIFLTGSFFCNDWGMEFERHGREEQWQEGYNNNNNNNYTALSIQGMQLKVLYTWTDKDKSQIKIRQTYEQTLIHKQTTVLYINRQQYSIDTWTQNKGHKTDKQ